MADSGAIRIESSRCKVIDLAAAADCYEETAEDASWFDRLHPSIVKPHDCSSGIADENAAPTCGGGNAKSGAACSAKQSARSKGPGRGAGRRAQPVASAATAAGRRAAAAAGGGGNGSGGSGGSGVGVGGRRRRNPGSSSGASGSSNNKQAGVVSRAAVAEDDDIMAMLARHNKQFKPKARYVARTHSSRDVKRWEMSTGKKWYELSPDERETANDEIAAMLAKERQAKKK